MVEEEVQDLSKWSSPKKDLWSPQKKNRPNHFTATDGDAKLTAKHNPSDFEKLHFNCEQADRHADENTRSNDDWRRYIPVNASNDTGDHRDDDKMNCKESSERTHAEAKASNDDWRRYVRTEEANRPAQEPCPNSDKYRPEEELRPRAKELHSLLKKDQLHYHELLLPRAERHYSEASENDPSAPVFGITREHRSWEQQAPVLPKRQTPMERPNDAQRAGFLQAEMHHPAAREYVFAAYARAPPMDMDFRMFVDKDIPTHQMLDQMSRIPMVNDKHVHDTRPFMQHPDSMDLHRGMLGPHRMDLI